MREVASTPAAEKGGQPTVLDVDVDVSTIAKNKTRGSRGKRKTPPESSVEPVKTPAKDYCSHRMCEQEKSLGVVKRKKKASKRNVVVTLPTIR